MAKIVDENGQKYEYKLVVFEGPDGVGKSTIATNFHAILNQNNHLHIMQHFPNKMAGVYAYSADPTKTPVMVKTLGTTPVNEYLNGKVQIQSNPNAVAHLYTQDRLLTWYMDGYISENTPSLRKRVIDMCKESKSMPYLVFDRYTQSSMIYQGADMLDEERNEFCDWLENYEYDILKLPRPDYVIYIDGDLEYIIKAKDERAEAWGETLDIHESNNDYIADCVITGRQLALYRGWHSHNYIDRFGKYDNAGELAKDIYKLTRGEPNVRFGI